MNRFHSILIMVILSFASFALASERNLVDGKWLGNGYFDIAKVDDEGKFIIGLRDSASGVYLHVEYGFDGPCCVSPEYLRLSIAKDPDGKQNDTIWVLTDYSDIDSLHSGLKKGKSLTLENFTKLVFDSTHVQYLVNDNNHHEDVEINRNIPEDSVGYFDSSLPVIYFYDYILYKRENMVTALCGILSGGCYYEVGCFYQNDGSFVFDSLPDPTKMVGIVGCPDGMEYSIPFSTQKIYKQSILDVEPYKVNGVPATKNSSNIVIQNKQPKLRLKGN